MEVSWYTLKYLTFILRAEIDNEVHINITTFTDLDISSEFTSLQTIISETLYTTLRTSETKLSTTTTSTIRVVTIL